MVPGPYQIVCSVEFCAVLTPALAPELIDKCALDRRALAAPARCSSTPPPSELKLPSVLAVAICAVEEAVVCRPAWKPPKAIIWLLTTSPP